jgi:L-lactate dehydrogenase (cytochrome)/glycolate oxidase
MLSRGPITSVEHARLIAEKRLPKAVFGFTNGGSSEGLTVEANRDGFREIELRPQVALTPVAQDISVDVFGRRLSFPVVCAPAGFIRILHPDGERGVAKAAQAVGTAVGISTMASQSIEEITRVADDVWYQLYTTGGPATTDRAIGRAQDAGCRVLIVTVDSAALVGPDRPRMRTGVPNHLDLATALQFAPEMVTRPRWLYHFLRGGLDLHLPNCQTANGQTLTIAQARRAIAENAPTWVDLRHIRERWTGPLLLKGILTAEDTRRAVDIGADGIIVSNHGGNSLDTVSATIRALPEVAAAADGSLEILLDGGIRRGVDIVKALAMGARAVLVGRAYVWGLAAGGQAGAQQVLEALRNETSATMAALGCAAISDLDRSRISLPSERRDSTGISSGTS